MWGWWGGERKVYVITRQLPGRPRLISSNVASLPPSPSTNRATQKQSKMTPSTGPDASETNLVELLQSLNIGNSGSWAPDVHLPVDAINTAFNGASPLPRENDDCDMYLLFSALPAQFLLIHVAFGAPQLKPLIPDTWKALKSSLVTAVGPIPARRDMWLIILLALSTVSRRG